MSDSRFGIKYTAESKSWLQVLHAISKLQSDNRPEVRLDEKYTWTTVFEVANSLNIKDNHAGNVMKLLVHWKLVRRWKGKSTGGRPPFHYRVTGKGYNRLARADKELGDEWWLLPETRSGEERGLCRLKDNDEPKRGTPFHETWRITRLQKINMKLQAEYLRLREQQRRETGY
ncbi:MAG: hypothetical protein QGG57_06685 [Candidatus Poseidoniia archaeon]|jgi:predicted transcriptional regulator|nr:hypothetical protein [Candidatus Poseidoniia archaeon]